MTPSLYVFVGGLITAAVGGVRYWLTRGRKPDRALETVLESSASGTGVPEGTQAEKAPKEK
jgi:hypothetical protein